jgi:hypothetical protein
MSDIVIDHFFTIAGKDLSSVQAKAIFGLVKRGKAWVKFSGGYIFSPIPSRWSDMTAVARAPFSTYGLTASSGVPIGRILFVTSRCPTTAISSMQSKCGSKMKP